MSGSFFEFGDFSFSNVSSICDGVELPLSWSLENSFNSALSFFVPVEGEERMLSFYDLLSTLSTSQSVRKSSLGSLSDQPDGSIEPESIATIANEVKQSINSDAYVAVSVDENTPEVGMKMKTVQSNVTNPFTNLDVLESFESKMNSIPVAKETYLNTHSTQKASLKILQNGLNGQKICSNDTSTCSSGQINGIEQPIISAKPKIILQHSSAHKDILEKESNPVSSNVESQEPLILNGSANGLATSTSQYKDNNQNDSIKDFVTEKESNKPLSKSNDDNETHKAILKKDSLPKPVLVKPELDPQAKYFAAELAEVKLVCKPKAFVPRGLFNSKNWCYINATLQALLACPPFFHLLKRLAYFCEKDRSKTSTPIMDCFVRLASKFRSLSYQYCHQHGRDIKPDHPFTPYNVYEMLDIIESSLRVGGQEDAEEFLSCILNGFHEEILMLFKLLPNGLDINGNDFTTCDDKKEISSEGDACASFANSKHNTPISSIFRGEMCIIVTRPDQESSISYETFFTLPLDVSMEFAWSIEDALFSLTDGEQCHDSDSDSEQTVIRKQTIERLPPILLLHLKRFFYDKNGGLLKVDKKVHFKTDLIIDQKWLSESAENYTLDQRSYKLFAVVYHHGLKATGGHYTADVFHIGLRSWLHFDDQTIYPIKLQEVINHSSKKTPYLLYYRQLQV